MGATASTAREPIPLGRRASRASQLDTVRVEENVSVNRWKEVASGGWDSDVTPSFFIITFCAWIAGFVARWRDFIASRSLRLMEVFSLHDTAYVEVTSTRSVLLL